MKKGIMLPAIVAMASSLCHSLVLLIFEQLWLPVLTTYNLSRITYHLQHA